MNLKENFPIFGLNLAPLPGEIVPLNIFEPRYVSMFKKCISNKEDPQHFAIVNLENSTFSKYGCTMKIIHFEKVKDKELYFILALAQVPCLFDGITKDIPFPQGTIKLLASSTSSDSKVTDEIISLITKKNETQVNLKEVNSLNSFDLALVAGLSLHEKIDILSIPSEDKRLERVLEFMRFNELCQDEKSQQIH